MIQSTVQKLQLWRKLKILEKHNFLEKKCTFVHYPMPPPSKKKTTKQKNQQIY